MTAKIAVTPLDERHTGKVRIISFLNHEKQLMISEADFLLLQQTLGEELGNSSVILEPGPDGTIMISADVM